MTRVIHRKKARRLTRTLQRKDYVKIDLKDFLIQFKLETFANKTVKSKTSTEKEIQLKADKNLFSLMTIVAQIRQLDIYKKNCHPLGPVPWALSTSSGSMQKTSRAVMSQAFEKLSTPVQDLPDNIVTIIDAMSIVQKVKGNHNTFGEVSIAIFRKIFAEAKGSRKIDVVFDRDISIKNIERMGNKSSSAAPVFQNILSSHKVQQWSHLMVDTLAIDWNDNFTCT